MKEFIRALTKETKDDDLSSCINNTLWRITGFIFEKKTNPPTEVMFTANEVIEIILNIERKVK